MKIPIIVIISFVVFLLVLLGYIYNASVRDSDNFDFNNFNLSNFNGENKQDFDKIIKKKQDDLFKITQNSNLLRDDYMCYDTTFMEAQNKSECELHDGTWDAIPYSDSGCPFFNANKNYPNTFGGMIGDACQLPKNMKRRGKTKFSMDKKYQPLCYNCQTNNIGIGSLGFCCDDQKDSLKYPNLLSPDYAFDDDKQIRQKYSNDLILKRLLIE